MALKWYYASSATPAQYERISRLVHRTPSNEAFELWPADLASATSRESFGYLMPIREPRFQSLSIYIANRMVTSLEMVCTAASNLADAFLDLHTAGLCYADISYLNIFIDPLNGDIRVCDNDNVVIDGQVPDVNGTAQFMAPELMRDEDGNHPSASTDRHSLAVVLFGMLVRAHPLYGARERAFENLDFGAVKEILGYHPIFIFDPNDDSNRPVESVHDNPLVIWPTLPAYVQELFIRCFTRGLVDPVNGRPAEAEWRQAIRLLRELIRRCDRCGTAQFYDPVSAPALCAHPTCGASIPSPPILRARAPIVLGEGKPIYEHTLLQQPHDDLDRLIARVVRHPESRQLALRNASSRPWTVFSGTGTQVSVEPGRAMVIRDGMEVSFGDPALASVVGRFSSAT